MAWIWNLKLSWVKADVHQNISPSSSNWPWPPQWLNEWAAIPVYTIWMLLTCSLQENICNCRLTGKQSAKLPVRQSTIWHHGCSGLPVNGFKNIQLHTVVIQIIQPPLQIRFIGKIEIVVSPKSTEKATFNYFCSLRKITQPFHGKHL